MAGAIASASGGAAPSLALSALGAKAAADFDAEEVEFVPVRPLPDVAAVGVGG